MERQQAGSWNSAASRCSFGQLSRPASGGALSAESKIQRSTTYTHYEGAIVYELTSPQGIVYRMQSYSRIVDPSLTIDDLETLGARLTLPEGWSHEARVLVEEERLTADGLAFVINEDPGNLYQRVTEQGCPSLFERPLTWAKA